LVLLLQEDAIALQSNCFVKIEFPEFGSQIGFVSPADRVTGFGEIFYLGDCLLWTMFV
jgi:hypothetical protein